MLSHRCVDGAKVNVENSSEASFVDAITTHATGSRQ